MKSVVIHIPETKSTNSYALTLLSKERPEDGCVIITDNQTEGKGTDSNSWESERGKNLTFSLILYPTLTADRQFILNKAISLGIYDFLVEELPGSKVSIKWPNDIYIEDKKICGILIQNSVIGNKLEYMVVGIGLNVNQTLFTGKAPNPVSMKMITGTEFNLEGTLQKLLYSVFERYTFTSEENAWKIDADYLQALYRLQEWHYYLANGVKVKSKITGTNSYGQLELENETGEVKDYDLKEVRFII